MVAISDVLLDGGLTFKTYPDKGEGLKSEGFRGEEIYGWPLRIPILKYTYLYGNKNIIFKYENHKFYHLNKTNTQLQTNLSIY